MSGMRNGFSYNRFSSVVTVKIFNAIQKNSLKSFSWITNRFIEEKHFYTKTWLTRSAPAVGTKFILSASVLCIQLRCISIHLFSGTLLHPRRRNYSRKLTYSISTWARTSSRNSTWWHWDGWVCRIMSRWSKTKVFKPRSEQTVYSVGEFREVNAK